MTENDAARNEAATEEGAEAAKASDLTAANRKAEPLSSDLVIDITLGAAVVVAEFITQAAKHLQENGPAYLDVLESKGKPVRDRLREALRGSGKTVLRDVTFAPPASAEEEITALERRVRELEQQIASSGPVETPAEDATFLSTPAGETEFPSLAESPYAISETEEEQAQEEKIGREPGREEGV
jgi:hypothetical protein